MYTLRRFESCAENRLRNRKQTAIESNANLLHSKTPVTGGTTSAACKKKRSTTFSLPLPPPLLPAPDTLVEENKICTQGGKREKKPAATTAAGRGRMRSETAAFRSSPYFSPEKGTEEVLVSSLHPDQVTDRRLHS